MAGQCRRTESQSHQLLDAAVIGHARTGHGHLCHSALSASAVCPQPDCSLHSDALALIPECVLQIHQHMNPHAMKLSNNTPCYIKLQCRTTLHPLTLSDHTHKLLTQIILFKLQEMLNYCYIMCVIIILTTCIYTHQVTRVPTS